MAVQKKTAKKAQQRAAQAKSGGRGRTSSQQKAQTTKAAMKPKGSKTAEKLSALDAAVRVLAEAGQPMTCREMIEAMAAGGYWKSPAGKTPSATLSSAILRELETKSDQARFRKVGRGRFDLTKAAR